MINQDNVSKTTLQKNPDLKHEILDENIEEKLFIGSIDRFSIES
jgi:hypothetical protein